MIDSTVFFRVVDLFSKGFHGEVERRHIGGNSTAAVVVTQALFPWVKRNIQIIKQSKGKQGADVIVGVHIRVLVRFLSQ